MRILIIVQARTSSTRLPGKVLLPILGKPVLLHQLERINTSKLKSEVIVATSINSDDDIIVDTCEKHGYKTFRGDLNDLLDRHYKAAIQYDADAIVKIPSDCPLIDPDIIDRVLLYYINNFEKFDFVSNLHPATYPDGNDVEIMSFPILRKAWLEAEKKYELEHTTPFIWDNPHKFRIGNVRWETGLDYSKSHRFTLDYKEDYEFIKKVYEELYPKNPIFSLYNILHLLEKKPSILKVNEKYAGEYWYKNHEKDLKNVDNNKQRMLTI